MCSYPMYIMSSKTKDENDIYVSNENDSGSESESISKFDSESDEFWYVTNYSSEAKYTIIRYIFITRIIF